MGMGEWRVRVGWRFGDIKVSGGWLIKEVRGKINI